MTGHRWIAIGLLAVLAMAGALLFLIRNRPTIEPVEPAPPSLGLVERSAGPEAKNRIRVTGAPGHNAAQAILADRSPIRRLFRKT